MSERDDFIKITQEEADEAKRQALMFQAMHVSAIALNIVLGGVTTYLAAIGEAEKRTLASMAFVTTIAGTFEKTFGFGKKKTGFRKAKTEFQNLLIDVRKVEGDNMPDEYWEKLKKIRIEKTGAISDV